MKKNLRLLCLGLAAAALTTGFAQENVTLKYLKNSSFESGVLFWDVEFENQVWGKNLNKSKQNGFYGFSGTSLEVWNGSVLKPNSISQTMTNLPNGTYVFGAYVGASYNLATPTQPTKAEGVTDEEYKASAEYKEWKAEYDAIRAKFVADSVFGVTMFANGESIRVATEHPDRAEEKRHTVKFNIAAQVTDGTLTVGLDVDSTNCVYVTWDEAELYSFGGMSPEEALNAMAKIDAEKPVAIADTVKGKYMNTDTLAFLNEGYAAIVAVATPADFTAADEKLRWGVVLANRSANDYKKLANKIATVKENKDAMLEKIDEGDGWLYPWYAAATENMIAQAEAAYAGKAANRAEINELIDSLTLSYAELQFEELDYVFYQLGNFIQDNINQFGDGVGQYPVYWKDSLNRLANRGNDVLANFSRETALEDVKLIAEVENSIAACLGSVNEEHEGVLTAMPLVTLTEADGTIATQNNGVYTFRSEKYTYSTPIVGLRFTVTEDHWGGGSKHIQDNEGYTAFALSEFYLYDGKGNQIQLSENNISSNATHGLLNENSQWDGDATTDKLIDGDINTHFHSSYAVSPGEAHYLEVLVPGGLNLTEFSFGWDSRKQHQGIPKTVEVSIMTYASQFLGGLMESVTAAKTLIAKTPVGNAIGFYKADLSELNAALEAAEALIAAGGSEDDYQAALNTLNDAMDEVSDVPMNLPVAGKEYVVLSAGPFFAAQNVHKALTAYSDTTMTNRVWWGNLGKDSLEQVFTFEPIENEDDKAYFSMKNKATGLYVGEWYNEDGEKDDRVALYEKPDTIELVALGEGQIALHDGYGRLHAGDHNGGAATESAGSFGGINGVYSAIVHWNADAGSASAWYICEMSEMPLTALVEGASYESPVYYFHKNVSVVAFTADKATDFDNFTLKGVDGQVIEVELEQMGNTLLATLADPTWGFTFSFNNNEGVSTVTVAESKLGELRAAYDAAVALAPAEGNDVGQYSDLSDFNKAVAAAEDYFKKGATDAEVDAAVKAINDAIAALVPNMPVANKTYYMISALEAFEQNHEVPMAIYAKKNMTDGVETYTTNWFYISSKPTYHWEFVVAETKPANANDEAAKDTVLYNIKNVGTGLYVAAVAKSTPVQLTKEVSDAGLYSIDVMNGTAVALSLNGKKGGNDYVSLHCGGHSDGAGRAGNVVGWAASAGVSQWKIVEVESVLTDIDFTEIEDENDEAVSAKGIYDLYGRRVINPTAPGLYIIDGKKRIIK